MIRQILSGKLILDSGKCKYQMLFIGFDSLFSLKVA